MIDQVLYLQCSEDTLQNGEPVVLSVVVSQTEVLVSSPCLPDDEHPAWQRSFRFPRNFTEAYVLRQDQMLYLSQTNRHCAHMHSQEK